MKLNQRLLLICVVLVITITSCKKNDYLATSKQLTEKEIVEQFTIVPQGLNPVLQKIANKIKLQNDKTHFLGNLGNKVGVPIWTDCKFKSKSTNTAARNIDKQITEVIIPLSIPETETVDGFLDCTITPNDIDIDLYKNNNYEGYGFDNPEGQIDAEDIAITSMSFEMDIFNHSRYQILDDRLFASTITNSLPNTAPTEILIVKGPIATEVIIMITHHHCTHTGACAGGVCDECNYCVDTELLVTSIWNNAGGFGGGDNGGGDSPFGSGGGGGSSSGSTGWTAIPPPPPAPIVPTLPTDTVLNKISRAVSVKSDSMFNYANQPTVNKERGVIIVEKDGVIYTKNESEGDESSCEPNYTLAKGEKLIGELHTHQSGDTISKNRSCFSGEDISGLRYHLQYQYTMIIECGNVRYIAVIEDVSKAIAFFGANKPRAIINDVWDAAYGVPNGSANWQSVTQAVIVGLLDPPGSTGIGLYISNNSNKTTFTKLN
jgi:hypothetical protein